MRAILGDRHHFDPDDKDALWVWDTLQGAKFTENIFHAMTIFFGVVALLTLGFVIYREVLFRRKSAAVAAPNTAIPPMPAALSPCGR